MQKPFALIFDMDGVIADTSILHEQAWFNFCKNHRLSFSSRLFREKLFGMSNRETLKFLFSVDMPGEDFLEYEHEKENLFRHLAAQKLKPLPGLIIFLNEVKNSGYKMAVASSAPLENIVLILKTTGTDIFFDSITSADEIIHSKPHPEIFLKTASKLNFIPAHCYVFEDSFAGIQAGNRAGMKVIGVASTHKPDELFDTIHKIRTFEEITIQNLEDLFQKNKPTF